MDLGTLIKTLRNIGDEFTSYYGIETNINEVELVETNGKYYVKAELEEE